MSEIYFVFFLMVEIIAKYKTAYGRVKNKCGSNEMFNVEL